MTVVRALNFIEIIAHLLLYINEPYILFSSKNIKFKSKTNFQFKLIKTQINK